MPVIESPAKSDLPGYLTREVKDLILVAASLGWTVHVATDGQGVGIWSHDERKKHHFGTRRATRLNQVRRDLLRYARPDLKDKAERVLDGEEITDAEMVDVPGVREALVVHEEPKVAEPHPAHCAAWYEGLVHRQHKWFTDQDDLKIQPLLCEGVTEQQVESSTEPTVVSERIMVAKGREGEGYDSPTTMEQTLSDGTKRYVCRFPNCGYTSGGRGAVASHWARSKDHPQVDNSTRYEAEVPDARKYAPRKSRVEALAAVLADMLAHGETNPLFIAQKALTWVHEQSGQGTDLAAEREPLTAEETLDRIRMLLDQGQHQALINENNRLLTANLDLAGRYSEAVAAAEQAEAAAQSIREQWTALVDLVGSIREEQKGA